MFLPLSFSESETNGIKYFVHFSAFLRLIDWLIDWLIDIQRAVLQLYSGR
jgi:hypothetical protein